ncbi:YdeI/OmpD-associated family protein [Thermoplasmatota archaeon]
MLNIQVKFLQVIHLLPFLIRKIAIRKNNFANSYRNMYIGWIKNAKTDNTRTKRISEVVKRSKDNKKPGII